MATLLLVIVILVSIHFIWKWWGSKVADYFAGSTEEKKRQSLEDKIELLKKEAKDLKETDDELKISKQLEVIQSQLHKKEEELKELNKKFNR